VVLVTYIAIHDTRQKTQTIQTKHYNLSVLALNKPSKLTTFTLKQHVHPCYQAAESAEHNTLQAATLLEFDLSTGGNSG
jgi:hypothetical protein